MVCGGRREEGSGWGTHVYLWQIHMVFPVVVMYGCESWTINMKAEHQRIDAFELWFWRKLLRVPWSARDPTSQSWIFIERTDVETAAPILLATWCKELTHWKRPWYWERLKVAEEGDDRGWDGWMASPTQSTWVWVSSGSWGRTGKPGMLQSLGSQRVGHDWVTELNRTLTEKYDV